MLNFFRKYQKIVFLFVAVVVGISMLFFGTVNKGAGEYKAPVDETVITKTQLGRKITRDQIEKMARFITEKYLIEERSGGLPLKLHDGVLEKDFLQSGWASHIAQKYNASIATDLQGKLKQEQSYKLYKHPSMPMISIDHIWSQSLPDLSHAYTDFKRQLSFPPESKDAFDSRINLYVLNQNLPASFMKRILLYQQNVFAPETPDPALYHTDLSLFNYRNAEDWFGKNLIHIVAQTIYHLSDLAKASGIEVSRKEAELDLLAHAQENFATAREIGNQNLSDASFSQYFAHSIQRQGLSEKEAISLWKEILTYRKWIKSLGSGALVDGMSLSMFNEFANKSCNVRLVNLPSYMQFASDRGYQEFAGYLHAITKDSNYSLGSSFESSLKEVSQVKEENPSLVQTRISVGVKRVNLEDLAHEVTIKDMLDWQFADANWETLEKEFPSLVDSNLDTNEKRVNKLRSLTPQEQGDIDLFSRKQVALSRLGDLDQALANGQYQEEEWVVLATGQVIAGPSTQGNTLYTHLISDELNQPFEWKDDESSTFYSIEVIAREQDSLLTFKELKDYKLQDAFLSSLTEKHYESVKANALESLKDKEGNVKDAKRAAKPVLAYLLQKDPKALVKEKQSSWLASARKMVMEDANLASSQAEENENFSPRLNAVSQWNLDDEEITLDRASGHDFLNLDALFSEEEGAFSKVLTSSMGNTYFYKVLGFDGNENLKRGFALQQALTYELGKEVFEKEFDHIAQNEAISISYLEASSDS